MSPLHVVVLDEMSELEDYPRSFPEFQARFSTESACVAYLEGLRWPNGFVCPSCHGKGGWKSSRGLWECRTCGRQTSVTSGTLLHRSRSPLTKWFLAIWNVTSQKYGANALGLQRTLDLGSYQTAWEWLHRLRRAMVRPDRDRLSGIIEMDETYVGGKRAGKRGRGAEGKVAVGVAVEDKGEDGISRIRLGILPDVTSDSLRAFILQSATPDSTIRTDGLPPYNAIKKDGYTHVRVGSKDLHLAHRVIALLKRWLLGTYQGAVRPGCLPFYLDEFTFRFNRRSSASRGKLFFRLVQQIVQIPPEPRQRLVGRCKGQAENELDSDG